MPDAESDVAYCADCDGRGVELRLMGIVKRCICPKEGS